LCGNALRHNLLSSLDNKTKMLACSCLFRLCLAYLIAVESQLIAYDLSVADYESLRTFEPAIRTGNEVIQ
jgi:hypothetical protein